MLRQLCLSGLRPGRRTDGLSPGAVAPAARPSADGRRGLSIGLNRSDIWSGLDARCGVHRVKEWPAVSKNTRAESGLAKNNVPPGIRLDAYQLSGPSSD
ncbi:hypothetical protein MPL3356_380075 [Mesorhizobium plurifarium]|uniref:Uncharacterized protein n=1 Tax=Mesorhizobium plurifarium TaxID=69974 RepID=A0A090DX80_MESPL|nr:hypothetical protein MPL3356_380075 [Mesorhizobium plurifarium]